MERCSCSIKTGLYLRQYGCGYYYSGIDCTKSPLKSRYIDNQIKCLTPCPQRKRLLKNNLFHIPTRGFPGGVGDEMGHVENSTWHCLSRLLQRWPSIKEKLKNFVKNSKINKSERMAEEQHLKDQFSALTHPNP